MLVDKYEVMWLGSQKSVRWFCLDLIFFKKKKKKKSVFHLNYQTLSNPSFSLSSHGTLQVPSFLTKFFLTLLPSSYSCSDLSGPCFQSPVLAFLLLTFPWMVVLLRVASSNSILFIYVSSLEISFIATTSKTIFRLGDKPQVYILMPYFFTEFQIFRCIVGVSAWFSQTFHIQSVPNSTGAQNVFFPLSCFLLIALPLAPFSSCKSEVLIQGQSPAEFS